MSVRIRSRSVGFITGTQMSLIDGASHVLGPFTNYAGVYAAPVEVKGGQVAIVGSDGTTIADVTTIGPDKAIKVDVVASVGGGGGGTAMTDKAAFAPGVTQFTPIGGEMDDVAPNLATEGLGAACRITPYRGLHVSLRKDSDGTEMIGQQTMALSIPVAIASNQGNVPTNIAQINGVTPLMGSGIMGTGSHRVTIASDNDALTVKQGTAANLKVEAAIAAAQTLATVTTVSTVTNLAQMNGTALLMGSGIMGTGAQRVVIASDNDPVTVKQGTAANLKVEAAIAAAQTLATVTTVGTVTNLSQMNGVAISMGSGIMGTGVQRVAISSDNDPVPTKSTAANAKVDIGLINAVAPLMGSGIMGTGSLRVTIASDNDPLTVKQATAANLNAQVVGTIAHDGVDSGNPVKVGAKAYNALLTSVANADRADLICDLQGRLIIAGFCPPELIKYQTTNNTNVTETTIVTAGSAGIFNDILCITATNKSSVQSKLSLRDATTGTVRMVFLVPANGGIVISPSTPMAQTSAAANWTMQMGTTGTDTDVSVMYTTRK